MCHVCVDVAYVLCTPGSEWPLMCWNSVHQATCSPLMHIVWHHIQWWDGITWPLRRVSVGESLLNVFLHLHFGHSCLLAMPSWMQLPVPSSAAIPWSWHRVPRCLARVSFPLRLLFSLLQQRRRLLFSPLPQHCRPSPSPPSFIVGSRGVVFIRPVMRDVPKKLPLDPSSKYSTFMNMSIFKRSRCGSLPNQKERKKPKEQMSLTVLSKPMWSDAWHG